MSSLSDFILAFLRRKQFQEGFDMVNLADIKDEILLQLSIVLEQMAKEGLIYQPRYGFYRVTGR